MKSRTSLGPVLAAAFAFAADEPPPLARAGHAQVRGTIAPAGLMRPEAIHTALHIRHAMPNISQRHVRGRGGEKTRDTLDPPQIALDAGRLTGVRAGATQTEHDVYRRNPVVHDKTPPAQRAPPASTDC